MESFESYVKQKNVNVDIYFHIRIYAFSYTHLIYVSKDSKTFFSLFISDLFSMHFFLLRIT